MCCGSTSSDLEIKFVFNFVSFKKNTAIDADSIVLLKWENPILERQRYIPYIESVLPDMYASWKAFINQVYEIGVNRNATIEADATKEVLLKREDPVLEPKDVYGVSVTGYVFY